MKSRLPDLIAILVFVAISCAYFFTPVLLENRILFQHDSAAGIGAAEEAKEFYEATGERTRWTNSLFGGMPTYQITPSYDSAEPLKSVQKLYHLFLPDYVWYLFILLLGFYILLRALGLSAWLSTLGAIFWAFSSYFFILISAGHIWKFITLAYIPPTIAGMVWVYRKKYLLGGIVTALFVALQILSNHVQMTYYFMFVMLFLAIAYGVDAWKKGQFNSFVKGTLVLMVAALVGVAINLPNLYHTYEYSKHTMRGKSELTFEGTAAQQTSSGLNRDYITQWSYGIGETFTLLVPNTKGGASVPLAGNPDAMKKANPMYAQIYGQIGQYWGEQPGTSGPVYVGAFVLMLFVLGLFIVKGPVKWALFAATLLSVLLSWGHNFMPFTDFFIDYVPMYNKFRAVSSILVIAEFTIPLLAILALKEVIEKPQLLKEQSKYFYLSFAVTAGLALLFAVAPRFFFSSFVSASEMAALQSLPAEHLAPIIANLEDMRIAIFTTDAWRSFFIVAIGAVLLFVYAKGKLRATFTIAAIAVLCLADMWAVNKRYLNDSQFVPRTQKTVSFNKTEADEFILQDATLSYRVLNLAGNTFNENNTSYWHKSIGGYHAAKLRRYQELIDRHIGSEMQLLYSRIAEANGAMEQVDPVGFPVLNMLDTKYVLMPAQGGKSIPVENPYAYGNAWFVERVKYVANANEEIDALGEQNLLETAVADQRFEEVLHHADRMVIDSLAEIKLTAYAPNRLTYEYTSPNDAVAVFSEIYYPGWKATVDGNPVELARANYVLRALHLPGGSHTIEMTFEPSSVQTTERIAYGAFALLVLGAVLSVLNAVRCKRKKNASEKPV